MGDEITFRSSVGGYRRDEVLEYVESMNDTIYHMKKDQEKEAADYQEKIQELKELLKQEKANNRFLADEEREKLEVLEEENGKLQEQLTELEVKYKTVDKERAKAEGDKRTLKEKLGREVLRLRSENQRLEKELEEAKKKMDSRTDYEAVHSVVSEVQYKIAEYVNIINKTQQSLAETYQSMNGVKKKIAKEIENQADK